MEALPGWAISLSGALIGAIVGFCVKRARLCTFGAVEDIIIGNDARRMKVFALALGVAILATQALIAAGALHPDQIRYLPSQIPWFSIALGSLLFGFGMALVGTCAFGSLIRLGSGDLRSLLVLLVFASAAYAMLRGVLADIRLTYLEAYAIAMPTSSQSDLPGIVDLWFGGGSRIWLSAAIAACLLSWCLSDRRLRRAKRLLITGLVLGFGVAAGWLVTGVLSDDFSLIIEPQSLTFVSPVAKAYYALALPGSGMDFGIATVFGVILGAALAALIHDEFRWEAFDDHREMKRHLLGALCMGLGGVAAGGCTIGQGLTAGSVLALSWPIAVAGMALGARLGIAVLVEGSLRGLLSRILTQSMGSHRQ